MLAIYLASEGKSIMKKETFPTGISDKVNSTKAPYISEAMSP